jgi:hypothetical protein
MPTPKAMQISSELAFFNASSRAENNGKKEVLEMAVDPDKD